MGYKAEHSSFFTWCLKFFSEDREQPSILPDAFPVLGQGSRSWSIPWSIPCPGVRAPAQPGVHRVLQEQLPQQLLGAPTIPRGTALVSPLLVLLSALFPFLVSPLFTPLFTLAGAGSVCEGCRCQQRPTAWDISMAQGALVWRTLNQGGWDTSDFYLVFLVPCRSVCSATHSPDQPSSTSSGALADSWADRAAAAPADPPSSGSQTHLGWGFHLLISEGVGGRTEQCHPPLSSCTHQISLSNLSSY